MVEMPGAYTNFEHIEDSLSIDELMMLFDMILKIKHEDVRIQAAIQGVEMEDDGDSSGGEPLPPEILEHERAWKEKKKEIAQDKQGTEFTALGLGYSKA